MSKRGQALIEAIAGLGVCTLFLTCCLKLWLAVINEFKDEQLQREKQLCTLTRTERCPRDSGFVLVTMLMQLTVLIFAAHVFIAAFLTDQFRWKISNWCFESALQNITEQQLHSATDPQSLQNEVNAAAPSLIQFKTTVSGPFNTLSFPDGITESFYNLQWAVKPEFKHDFFSATESIETFKCGARKICHDQKCIYSLIADKS